MIENLNRPGTGRFFFNDAAQGSRLNNQYAGINTRGKSGYSNYNAMIAEIVASRFRNLGFSFSARYTYGKAFDNLSSTFSEAANNFNLGLLDPFNPQLDYGPADFDIRHRFTTGFNWEVPFDKIGFGGDKGWAQQLLGGWD